VKPLAARAWMGVGAWVNLGSGGPCRTRTYDLLIKSQQLYQLS
jgi:hypothetical protein